MTPAFRYTSPSPNSIRFVHSLQGPRAGASYSASQTKVLGFSAEHMSFVRGPLVVVVSNIGGKDANAMT
jgi:hypothetical protein